MISAEASDFRIRCRVTEWSFGYSCNTMSVFAYENFQVGLWGFERRFANA